MTTLSRWRRLFNAITFAEAGEFDTAREMLRERERQQEVERYLKTKRLRYDLRNVAPIMIGRRMS